jgi:hypothetical protein
MQAEFTTGGEFHPALKRCAIIIDLFLITGAAFYRSISHIDSNYVNNKVKISRQ